MKYDIYVCYSHKDQSDVKQLVKALKSSDIRVWVDYERIISDDKAVSTMEDGIMSSSFIGVWATKESMTNSDWVTKEYETMMQTSEHPKERTIVMLRDDCISNLRPMLKPLPNKLSFSTESYDSSLDSLISILLSARVYEDAKHISPLVEDYLNQLKTSSIKIPLQDKPIEIIENLKKLPRSGKKLRFKKNNIPLPARSVYDHIMSVAHTADLLWEPARHNLADSEMSDLAQMIAYHDVCEVLLGDLPAFTDMDTEMRNVAESISVVKYGTLPEGMGAAESITNDFIYLHLKSTARDSMQAAEFLFKNHESDIYKFFLVLDKIDPIISIWRYMYHYKTYIRSFTNDYLKVVKAFFMYPRVKQLCREYTNDNNFFKLISILQNETYAKKYIEDEFFWSNSAITGNMGFPASIVRQIIEGRDLSFPNSENKLHSPKKSST